MLIYNIQSYQRPRARIDTRTETLDKSEPSLTMITTYTPARVWASGRLDASKSGMSSMSGPSLVCPYQASQVCQDCQDCPVCQAFRSSNILDVSYQCTPCRSTCNLELSSTPHSPLSLSRYRFEFSSYWCISLFGD